MEKWDKPYIYKLIFEGTLTFKNIPFQNFHWTILISDKTWVTGERNILSSKTQDVQKKDKTIPEKSDENRGKISLWDIFVPKLKINFQKGRKTAQILKKGENRRKQ